MALPDWLAGDPRVRYAHHRDAAIAIGATWPSWAPPDVLASITAAGITEPWRHQIEAAEVLHSGHHVALSTPTASGKSLAYLLPILAATASAEPTVGSPLPDPAPLLGLGATRHNALYLAPTKALAHDQLRVCRELGPSGWRVSTLDGDSDEAERRFARDHATYVLSNPDMLHRSVLPNHARWRRFLGSLRYVVVDEAHRYRGVFGAHVSQVLRRLRRLCALYGASPVFVCSSATVTDAVSAAARLIGEDEERIVGVDWDTSPRGARDVLLWQPGSSTESDAAELLAALVDSGHQTLAFLPSRKGAELTALHAQRLRQGDAAIAAYRAGYLAHDRRELEGRLQTGELRGVAATNALELGVDISGMDAVVIAGFPGTLASFWQQAGRAGRRTTDATVILVARDDPLDAYLFDHPDLVFDTPAERVVLDPDNPYVLAPHVAAAAQEAPITLADERWFGPGLIGALDALVNRQVLRQRPTGWYWTHPHRAVDGIDLRSMGGRALDIVETTTGRVVGSVDPAAVDHTAHEGAVYLHQGDQWLVERVDADECQVLVRREQPGYYTQARSESTIRILDEVAARPFGRGRLSLGKVELTSRVISYLRRDASTHAVWDETPLDLPDRRLVTQGVWWTLDQAALGGLGLTPVQLAGAAHGAEHAAIGLLPVVATCDRWDVGGLSTLVHPDTGTLTVFVHDGHPGGAGFAAAGYAAADTWLAATLHRLRGCPCEVGCPACVVSPKCGNANQLLDKQAARTLVALLID